MPRWLSEKIDRQENIYVAIKADFMRFDPSGDSNKTLMTAVL